MQRVISVLFVSFVSFCALCARGAKIHSEAISESGIATSENAGGTSGSGRRGLLFGRGGVRRAGRSPEGQEVVFSQETELMNLTNAKPSH